MDKYKDKEGKNKTRFYVLASNIIFLGAKQKEEFVDDLPY